MGIVADKLTMKKDIRPIVVLVFFFLSIAASALDWKIPVFTLKYEVTEGTIEDPDPDEDIQIPSSLRNTVSLHLKEAAYPFTFGLTARYSTKDYLLQNGDYSYLTLDQDAKLAALDVLDLGLAFGGKWAYSPLPDSDGLSKDYLALKTRVEAGLELFKGTTLDIGLTAEYDLNTAEVKARQFYTAGVGLTSRLGEWLFSGRYRGVFRLPLGVSSTVQNTMLNEGSFSFQWDPNR
jgi:hypothetical protein